MAKNFIEEYFIGLKLDTKDAEKGLSILNKYEKQLEKIMKMQGKPKPAGNPFKPVVEAGKEFEKVEAARKKRMQAQEEANYKRGVDLAKVAYSKKVAATKQAVNKIIGHEEASLKKMKSFYLQMAEQASDSKSKAEKEFNIVANALNKKRIADEKEAYGRSVALAKIALDKKAADKKAYTTQDVARTKQAVKKLIKEEDTKIAKMRQFYKEEEALAKRNARLKERLQEKANAVLRTQFARDMQEKAPARHAQYQQKLKQQINMGSAEGIKEVAAQMRTSTREMKRSLRSLAVVQNGLNDSTRNMVRSYVSLFALFEGTTAIKRVGMDFEGMEASMLAVAGNAEKAGVHLKFLREQSMRLGFDMAGASKGYIKLAVAAGNKLKQSELEEVFLSVAESAKVFQLSSDDMMGSIKAIQQMFSKSGIMAQEFKEQLKIAA